VKNLNFTLCIWSGLIAYILFVLSGVANGFWTPMAPTMSAADVVAYYQAHLTGIRIGAILFLLSPAFYIGFTAVITEEMKRIEGPSAPLAWTQLILGIFTVLPFFPTAIFWTAAAFRLDRPAEITQTLNDIAWLFDVMPGAPAGFQPIVIGLAILGDKNRVPVFPRWFAYFNFFIGILFLGGLTVGIFKTGPFAWNGLVPYWLPSYAFTAWIFVTFFILRGNNKKRQPYFPA
jgi:hypothetical protein